MSDAVAVEETTDEKNENNEEMAAICTTCAREFKNQHGLDIHWARTHKKKDKKDKKKVKKSSNGASSSSTTTSTKPSFVADSFSVEDDGLHIMTEKGEKVITFSRPSMVLDLHDTSREAARKYVESLEI